MTQNNIFISALKLLFFIMLSFPKLITLFFSIIALGIKHVSSRNRYYIAILVLLIPLSHNLFSKALNEK